MLSGREPARVTLEVGRHVSNLRTRRAFGHVVPAFFAARTRRDLRLVQFSVQHDHLHLPLLSPGSGAAPR